MRNLETEEGNICHKGAELLDNLDHYEHCIAQNVSLPGVDLPTGAKFRLLSVDEANVVINIENSALITLPRARFEELKLSY